LISSLSSVFLAVPVPVPAMEEQIHNNHRESPGQRRKEKSFNYFLRHENGGKEIRLLVSLNTLCK
jgi:hypothetical protein